MLINIKTEFAGSTRQPLDIIERQSRIFDTNGLTGALLEAVNGSVLFLNSSRQIVHCSNNFLGVALATDRSQLLGRRPGEALNCVHATEQMDGCGAAAACAECGAFKAILAGLIGRRDVQECRMLRVSGGQSEALDLLVSTVPFRHHGEAYCLCAVTDISHRKRRQALERFFFHDLINTAGGLESLLGMLHAEVPAGLKSEMALAKDGFQDLLDQVWAQRDLLAAERDELQPELTTVNVPALLESLTEFYRHHPVAKSRWVKNVGVPAGLAVKTDPTLLRRILGNLIKNALEATPPEGTVTTGSDDLGANVRFWVHNSRVMPVEVQLQLFNRSFSTKGAGRGLGTYSVRLLAERYLGGRVAFCTSPTHGTTFTVVLPKAGPPVPPGRAEPTG